MWTPVKTKLRENKWHIVAQLSLMAAAFVPVLASFLEAPKEIALAFGAASAVVTLASLVMQVAERAPDVSAAR